MILRGAMLALLGALLLPQPAPAARYAVGAASLADLPRLERLLGSGAQSLAPIPALVLERKAPPRLASLPGATYVERLTPRRPAFVPDDPLFPRQWHLGASRAFDVWESPPLDLPRVRVAVVDSGVDGEHPDLKGRIVGSRSFVGGSALEDEQGHGTFVAGLIAAGTNNTTGIAGLGLSADLLVAKVVDASGAIDVAAEARAITWAVARGARVINMSLGGLRDPGNAERDGFSRLEADAVAYAKRRNVVVVAAVGNSDGAPRRPWRYASYPAALPHVLGVSALARNGSSPPFSNRDRIFNDLAAPGQGIVSTLPRALTARSRDCEEQGYSTCGPEDYRAGEGTSFAAPQVSAAAALLLALRPRLRAEQVTSLLTRTAADAKADTGCRACAPQRDELTGWGRLDVTAAIRQLSARLPPRDALEPNDDAGPRAVRLGGAVKRIDATLDFWDDQNDVYAIRLRRGQPVYVSVRGPASTDTNLILWQPGVRHVDDLASAGLVARQSARPGPREHLQYRAKRAGWHYVQVKLGSRGAGRYRLTIVKA